MQSMHDNNWLFFSWYRNITGLYYISFTEDSVFVRNIDMTHILFFQVPSKHSKLNNTSDIVWSVLFTLFPIEIFDASQKSTRTSSKDKLFLHQGSEKNRMGSPGVFEFTITDILIGS